MTRIATIASDRLYWAIVDPAPIGRRLRPAEIAALAEDVLPLPIESLHIVQRRLRDGRILVCAAEPDDVRACITSETLELHLGTEVHGESAETNESALPVFMAERVGEPVRPGDLNLLVGAFEPSEVRTMRRRTFASAAAIAVLLAIVVSGGFIARGMAARRALSTVDERRRDVVQAVIARDADGGSGGPGALPAEMRLVAELRELRSTRSTSLPRLDDISALASAVLERWPQDAEARLDHARLSEKSIVIDGWARDAGEAQRVADSLGHLPGVRLEPPQVRAVNDGVTFTIVLTPHASRPHPATATSAGVPAG